MSNFTPQQIEQFLQEFFDVVGARQYVGARYVPIFGRKGEATVEWDNNAPYEPLSVVMHEGISYVSRQYVPKDVMITNTDYWVETYRFNAQVEQYRQEVLGYDNRIANNARAIADEAVARQQSDDQLLVSVADSYVPFPDGHVNPKFGDNGQILSTLGDGQTKWEDPVVVTSEIAGPLIEDWLDEHPEATTTVQDGSITDAKLVQSGGVLSRVADIDSILDKTSYGVYGIFEPMFEKGSLSNGNDDAYFGDSRMRTTKLKALCDILITVPDTSTYPTAGFAVNKFDSGGEFTQAVPWGREYTVRKDEIFRIVCSLTPGANTEATVSQIYAAFDFTAYPWEKRLTYKAVDNLTTDLFERGNSTGGVFDGFNYLNRARTGIIKLNNGVIVERKQNASAARVNVAYMNNSGTFISDSGWQEYVLIESGTVCTITITQNTGTATYASLSDIVNSFVITNYDINSFDDISNVVLSKKFSDILTRGTNTYGTLDSYYWQSRLCIPKKVKCSRDIVVYHKSGYFDVTFYEGQAYKNYAWRQNDFYIPANQEFSMNITNDYGANTYAQFDDIAACIDIEFVSETIGANPNAIIQCRNVDDTRYPPYSKYYIQAAAKNGYDRVRVNVRVTTDGHFVLIHDNTINGEARNMDGTVITNPVNSSGQTLSTLNSYDWGIKYGYMYAGMKVPELEEAAKFAANYNMGLSIETTDLGDASAWQSNIDYMASLLGEYGLLENLIVITANGSIFAQMEYWKTKSKYISYFIGGDPEDIMTWKTDIDSLVTGYNHIYVMPFPFGSVADQTLIDWCNENGYRLYNSSALNKTQLFSLVGFDHGNTLIEANNVYMPKNIIMRHADELVDE